VPGDDDWIDALCRAEGLPASYADSARDYVVPIAQRVAALRARLERPVIIGISGAQGTGKSTLAAFLAGCLQREADLSVVCLSLDDLYFSKAMRATIAKSVHPLLATRGVPGTHDVEVGRLILAALTDTDDRHRVTLPAFDKASDDRVAEVNRRRVDAPVDVVLFEGWCVGARPQTLEQLQAPVNALEANADANGAWRRYVNERLATDYARLFARLDKLIMLRVPAFEKVIEWRKLQEHKLRERLREQAVGSPNFGQTDEELAVFVMFYERLTRHMLESMPAYADTVIDIDAEHAFSAMSHRGW
jgi:D-glycerate 3-kinase